MTYVFVKIVEMSANASIVIAIIILLRLLLCKAPKSFSYVLWAAALFRLLCPVSFELPSAPVPYVEIPYSAEAAFSPDTGIISAPQSESAVTFIVTVVSYIWAAAAASMLLRGVVLWVKLSHVLKSAQKAEVGIYVSPWISDPFIMGIIRPKIYLPTDLSHMERELVIMHEKAHMRRGDHIAKLIMYAALCLHCFNPFVWLMFKLFERDMEMSCDEKVTADMTREQKAEYSQTLLKISSAPTAAFTAYFGESNTKQRVKNVLSFKKPAVWIMIILIVSVIFLTIFLCADKKSDREVHHSIGEIEYDENNMIISELIPAMGINGNMGYMKNKDYYADPDFLKDNYEITGSIITDEEELKTLRKRYYHEYGDDINQCTFLRKICLIPLYEENGENIVDYFRMEISTVPILSSENTVNDTVQFGGKTFNKAGMSHSTIEWLTWYNSLTEDEQLSVNYIPHDLYELYGFKPGEDVAVETSAD